jgi:hypothetical protein
LGFCLLERLRRFRLLCLYSEQTMAHASSISFGHLHLNSNDKKIMSQHPQPGLQSQGGRDILDIIDSLRSQASASTLIFPRSLFVETSYLVKVPSWRLFQGCHFQPKMLSVPDSRQSWCFDGPEKATISTEGLYNSREGSF